MNSVDRVLSLKAINIFYVIVPPNYTDMLQPLNVNKPAKGFLHIEFNNGMLLK